MPSALLSADNDYQAPPAPTRFVLDREAWDGLMAGVGGIGPRLRALEDVSAGIDAIRLELQQFGLNMLNEAITPLIEETVNGLDALQSEIGQTIADTNAALQGVQQQVDLILAGGIPAESVQEDGSRVFVTPSQRGEIGALRSDMTDAQNEISALAAGTYPKSETFSKAEVNAALASLGRSASAYALSYGGC